MNPVLLKPQADRTSQLVVHGQVRGTLGSSDFRAARGALLAEVTQSFVRLRARCDLVLVEGAGSPAEVNLRSGDIANMGFARAADVPVVLIGDIDRGGVIARSEEHTSELQSLMRISYAVFCLKKKKKQTHEQKKES